MESHIIQEMKRAPNITACNFYKSPTLGQKVQWDNVTFAWDTACFKSTPKYIDIYLLEPSSERGQIYLFKDVLFESGSYTTEIKPRWWDATPNVTLQVAITASGEPLFLSPIRAGPVFTSSYNSTSIAAAGNSTSGTSVPEVADPSFNSFDFYTNVSGRRSGLSKGRIAAAVLVPLLLALAALAGYVIFMRRREARKRQEWVENVDKRMSTISGDWHSMSAAGASAAARGSMATNRTPSMLFGGGRGSAHMDSASHTSPARQASIYDRFASKTSFASEDLSQLGPRARALSAAAAEGRPLSTLVREMELEPVPDTPLPDTPRGRSHSTNAVGDAEKARATARPRLRQMSSSQTRPISSNNPYAAVISQQHRSGASSGEGQALAFPTHSNSGVPRSRLDSTGRSADVATRTRVTSRVSFVEVARPSAEREREWRNLNAAMPQDAAARSSRPQRISGAHVEEYAIDFGDTLPALALMRTRSGEYDFPSDNNPLTPSTNFLPSSRAGFLTGNSEYFREPSQGVDGRTPDEMMRAYAAAMAQNEKEQAGTSGGLAASAASVFGSVRKFGMGLWKR